jgi:hypothetical protein
LPGVCVGGCPAGERTSRIVLRDPLSSHLGCAPIGRKREGQRCTLIADPAGTTTRRIAVLHRRCLSSDLHAADHAMRDRHVQLIPGHSFALGICG